ncbi:gliding motility-associated ABC transporter permease subunit GldF [Gynurincola endophyticus]|uniref:gliding motility-associated ABC transporter permease subunit GldF n=1 Tax=Gynurincola endophyticus TaxID=2479004 RepID=UPI000F8E0DFA|nr:gliding motility-associated ABC transporter permease subunit GldF [Gynurincola endophyticus]
MWPICKKEFQQFFSSLTGYIAIIVFLILTGLLLFVFPNGNILEDGYATLEKFFQTAPLILLFLVPAITMRSFADEFKQGTFEILQTKPLKLSQLVLGKYFGALLVVFIAILPTVLYVWAIQSLAETKGIDVGATIGSYIGLYLLAASFVAIGVFSSSITANAVVGFILAAFLSFIWYGAFSAIASIPVFEAGADYYIEMFGIDFHYRSISRGVVDTRDIVYFLTLIGAFALLTIRNLEKRTA